MLYLFVALTVQKHGNRPITLWTLCVCEAVFLEWMFVIERSIQDGGMTLYMSDRQPVGGIMLFGGVGQA